MIKSEVQLNGKGDYPKLVRNINSGSVAIAVSEFKLVKIAHGTGIGTRANTLGSVIDISPNSSWVELPVGSKVVLEQV